MGKAHINIEDGPDGMLNFQAVYVDGWNADSPAHCAVALLTKHMETLMDRVVLPQDQARAMVQASGVLGDVPPEALLEYLDETPTVPEANAPEAQA